MTRSPSAWRTFAWIRATGAGATQSKMIGGFFILSLFLKFHLFSSVFVVEFDFEVVDVRKVATIINCQQSSIIANNCHQLSRIITIVITIITIHNDLG